MGVYDGNRRSIPDKDPSKETQWQVGQQFYDVGGELIRLIEAMVDAAFDALDEKLKEVVEALIGAVVNPEEMIAQIVVWASQVPLLVGALDGINITEPGAVLTAIISALQSVVTGYIGKISISWLDNERQSLVDEAGYDAANTVVAPDANVMHDATDGKPGITPVGCLKFVANGTNLERIGKVIAVGKNWKLESATDVKWESLTATAAANGIRLELQPYFKVDETTYTPVGSRILMGAVASPSGNSGGGGGWGTNITGIYNVPGDGTVTHVALIPRCTSAVSAGTVKFDNTNLFATQDIPQIFVKDLVADLTALFGWVTGLLDDIVERLTIDDFDDFLAELLASPGDFLSDVPQSLISGLTGSITELNQIRDILRNLTVTPVNSAIQDVKDWWAALGGKVQNLNSSGQLPKANIPGLNTDLGNLSSDISNGLSGLGAAIWDGWFGSGGGTGGATTEAQTTIEAIKQAVLSGYTVDTITSSGTWNKPADITELIVICIGGGQSGAAGAEVHTGASGATAAGGDGGYGGSFLAQQLDPASVSSTVTCTIGTAGNPTTFGAYASASAGQAGGIATGFGYTPTSSVPGNGGKGGNAVHSTSVQAGTSGTASAVGAGGAGGASGTGAGTSESGDPGETVSAGVVTKCGGGGGGGGGGRRSTNVGQTVNGGAGGAGGYPGGGGGGGGGAANTNAGSQSGGSGGAGASGVLWVFYR